MNMKQKRLHTLDAFEPLCTLAIINEAVDAADGDSVKGLNNASSSTGISVAELQEVSDAAIAYYNREWGITS